MKHNTISLVVLVALLFFLVNTVSAQEKMSKEDWQKQLNEQTTKRNDLKARLDQATKDIATLKAQSAQKDADLRKCQDALYALVGADRSQVEEFGRKVDATESKINELSRLSNQDLFSRRGELDELKNQISELQKSKISLLPEHYDKLQELSQKLDKLKASLATVEKTYTVGTWAKDRDCLWNIAKKKDIYDNAFMWPKIWQGNRDKIKDPDLIYPGQKLTIPALAPLSSQEKSAANAYYRKKAGGSK